MDGDLNKLVPQVRRDILRMVYTVNSGHPGGSLGCVEFFVTLYKRVLKVDDNSDSNIERNEAMGESWWELFGDESLKLLSE